MDRAGEQLVDGYPVDDGQAVEAGDRDGPFATLVGAEHRGLELLLGHLFGVLERQSLLATDGPQPIAHLACVVSGLGIEFGFSRHGGLRGKWSYPTTLRHGER